MGKGKITRKVTDKGCHKNVSQQKLGRRGGVYFWSRDGKKEKLHRIWGLSG